jgi:hypothetical protein
MCMLFSASIFVIRNSVFRHSFVWNCFGWWNRIYLNSRPSTMIFSNNLKEGTHRKVPVNVKNKKHHILQSSRFLFVRWGSQKIHVPVPESHDNQRQVSLCTMSCTIFALHSINLNLPLQVLQFCSSKTPSNSATSCSLEQFCLGRD